MNSKRAYVRSLLVGVANEEALRIGCRIIDEYGDFEVRELVDRIEELARPGVSETTRRKLVEVLNGVDLSRPINLLEFPVEIWPLNAMDDTGKLQGSPVGFGYTAFDEAIHQHCVRLSNWSNTELLTRLTLLRSSNALLIRFLAACSHSRTQGEDEQRALARQLTDVLRP